MEWMEPWSGEALTMWFQAWIQGFVNFFAASMLALLSIALPIAIVMVAGITRVRRHFWCRQASREVDVQFERRAFFGGITAVTSCSAFECGAPISCHRRCLNATYRKQWEPPLPVMTGKPAE